MFSTQRLCSHFRTYLDSDFPASSCLDKEYTLSFYLMQGRPLARRIVCRAGFVFAVAGLGMKTCIETSVSLSEQTSLEVRIRGSHLVLADLTCAMKRLTKADDVSPNSALNAQEGSRPTAIANSCWERCPVSTGEQCRDSMPTIQHTDLTELWLVGNFLPVEADLSELTLARRNISQSVNKGWARH